MHSDIEERISTVGDKDMVAANAESMSACQISAQPFYCGLMERNHASFLELRPANQQALRRYVRDEQVQRL